MSDIPIQEDYDAASGALTNYDAYSTTQKFALDRQKHVDIRTFEPDEERIRVRMIHLNILDMANLNTRTMADLNGTVTSRAAEQWTNGTVAVAADRNNWTGITLALVAGTNTTESVLNR